MDAGSIIALCVGSVAAIIGAIGLVQAHLANKSAQEANRLAEVANQTSRTAVARAEDANSIAVDANQIAETARNINAAQLRFARDLVEYMWAFEADDDGCPIAIRNDCAYEAVNVAVRITYGTKTVFEVRQDRVAGFGDVPLDLGPTWQQHICEVRDAPRRRAASVDGVTVAWVKESATLTVRAWVDCFTPDESPRHQVLDYSVRHRFDGSGGVKLVPFPKKTAAVS